MWKTLPGAVFVLAFSLSGIARAELLPDERFGNGGTVELPLAASGSFGRAPGIETRVQVLADRRVVVAVLRGRGDNVVPNGASLRPSLAVTRLLKDGSVDPTFGTGAPVDLPLFAGAVDIAHFLDVHVRPDGSLYALIVLAWEAPDYPKRLLLVSVTADGRHDPAFNGGAPVILAEAAYNRAKVFETDSGYLVVGTGRVIGPAGDPRGFDAWRRHADGTPDTTFGNGGSVSVAGSVAGWGYTDVIALPDGGFKVLNATPGGPVRNEWRRYRADGSLDRTFGNGGVATIASVQTDDEIFTQVHPLGDGTYAATRDSTCVLRILDLLGGTMTPFDEPCVGSLTSDANVQTYGAKLLVSTPTKLRVIDRYGVLDADFAGSQGNDWSPSPAPAATYWSAADGDRGIVLATERGSGLVVQRYIDLRGIGPGQPIPALGLPGLLLVLGGAAVLARRRLAMDRNSCSDRIARRG